MLSYRSPHFAPFEFPCVYNSIKTAFYPFPRSTVPDFHTTFTEVSHELTYSRSAGYMWHNQRLKVHVCDVPLTSDAARLISEYSLAFSVIVFYILSTFCPRCRNASIAGLGHCALAGLKLVIFATLRSVAFLGIGLHLSPNFGAPISCLKSTISMTMSMRPAIWVRSSSGQNYSMYSFKSLAVLITRSTCFQVEVQIRSRTL